MFGQSSRKGGFMEDSRKRDRKHLLGYCNDIFTHGEYKEIIKGALDFAWICGIINFSEWQALSYSYFPEQYYHCTDFELESFQENFQKFIGSLNSSES